ncbi:hypothetical protein NBRC3299_1297 [Acetobacter pasteurianus NBRC 3299]|nr:hypothetical protein NBRC3299_1297 [Acetobacter pasteurianus NBRC 3299]
MGPTADFPVQYRIIGPNVGEIINISHEIRDILKNTHGTSDVQIDWGNRIISELFNLDSEKIVHFGSNRIAIAQQMQAFLSGETAGTVFNADAHRRGNLTEGLCIGLDYEKVCFAQKNFS